jgi:hypothetical protein
MMQVDKNEFYDSMKKYNFDPHIDRDHHQWICSENELSKTQTEEMLALAYLISVRRKVVETRFSNLMSWDGRHRSGKSVTAMSFSWLWDSTFQKDFENRIIVDPEDLLKTIDSAGKNFKLTGQIGVAMVIDEAGNTLSSSEWYEKWAKTINKLVQMFGYLCPQISFVAPVSDYVNSSLRKMFNTHYSMNRFSNDYSICKPYNLHYNSVTGHKYPKQPIIRVDGLKTKIRSLKIYGVSSEIIERYSTLEPILKDKLLQDHLQSAYAREEEAENEDPQNIIKQILEKYKFFLNKKGNGLDKDIIAYHFSLKGKKASYILRLAEKELEDVFKQIEPEKVKQPRTNKKERERRKEVYDESLDKFNQELGL